MSEIYYAFIVLPVIFLFLLFFVFQSEVNAIEQHQTIMNCPFPINSGIGNLTAFQNPPQINYTQTFDVDGDSYHVTTFECEFDPTSEGASINTRVYTGSNAWYDVTGRASGYMFYIAEVFDTIGIRIGAFGNMLYEVFTMPSQVTGLPWITYVQVVLILFIALGIFLMVRGG
jgi:hypothetical protein